MQAQPPGVNLRPRQFAAPDRQQSFAVFPDPHGDDALPQRRHAGEQQPDQVHGVLPANVSARAQVLLQLLELRQHVAVVGLIDQPREEDMAHV